MADYTTAARPYARAIYTLAKDSNTVDSWGELLNLMAAVASAGIGDRLDAVLSVEDVGVFKPDARVYEMVGERFGISPGDVLFVSSNGWDAAGATGFGFNTVWVNRFGLPVDRLPWTPPHILDDLTSIPPLAGAA